MILSDEDRQLIELNMNLVNQVLYDLKISNSYGVYSRDDLRQIGYIGLCKAAHWFRPGKAKFSTYAYTSIRNEIYDALSYASVRIRRQDQYAVVEQLVATDTFSDYRYHELCTVLKYERAKLSTVAARGIDALLLRDKGFTYREISRKYKVPENHVRAWIARARSHLKPLLGETG